MAASLEQPPVIIATILFLAFFAQALKELGIPSPGLTQSLLLYAGYQFSGDSLLFGTGIVLFTFMGSLSGACLVFCLAKFGGNRLLEKISIYSFLTVTVGRSIPGLMVPTSIVAGTLKMPIRKFLVGIIFPLSLWIIFYTTLGRTLGHFVPKFRFNPGSLLILSGVLLTLGGLASMLYHKKLPTDLKSDENKPIPMVQAKEDE
jgi:membrane protein DedA with SNARE-associated domain